MSWTVEQSSCIFSVTIAGFPVFDSAIGNGFLNASVGFRQIILSSHADRVGGFWTVPSFYRGIYR